MDLSLTPIEEWGFPLKDIFLSAGPCSAESEEQVLAIARDLSDSGISFMRAGLWKPRTHPGGFEGVGIEGLKWLTRAREKYNCSRQSMKRPFGNRPGMPGSPESPLFTFGGKGASGDVCFERSLSRPGIISLLTFTVITRPRACLTMDLKPFGWYPPLFQKKLEHKIAAAHS